jgi:hypothetical protein
MKARVLANPFRIELRSGVAYGLPTKWTQCLIIAAETGEVDFYKLPSFRLPDKSELASASTIAGLV